MTCRNGTHYKCNRCAWRGDCLECAELEKQIAERKAAKVKTENAKVKEN